MNNNTRYYCGLMFTGYKLNPKFEITASSDTEAHTVAWDFAKKAGDRCIGFQVSKKVGNSKVQFI